LATTPVYYVAQHTSITFESWGCYCRFDFPAHRCFPAGMGWANRVTIARLLLIAPFVICLLNFNDVGYSYLRYVAIGIFGVMALSDMLDGYLARRFDDQSPLGAFLDPLADKLLITLTVIILAINGVSNGASPPIVLKLPNYVAVAAIGKDLIVSIGFAVVYIFTGKVFIQPSRLGKWCTALELLMMLAMLLWMHLPGPLYHVIRATWIAVIVIAATTTIDYIRIGSRFIAESTASGARPGK
jgi:cardiolipin synthase